MLFKPSIIVGFLVCWSLTVLAIDPVEKEKDECYSTCWNGYSLCDCLEAFCGEPCDRGPLASAMGDINPQPKTKCQSTCDKVVRDAHNKCNDKCNQQYQPEQPKA